LRWSCLVFCHKTEWNRQQARFLRLQTPLNRIRIPRSVRPTAKREVESVHEVRRLLLFVQNPVMRLQKRVGPERIMNVRKFSPILYTMKPLFSDWQQHSQDKTKPPADGQSIPWLNHCCWFARSGDELLFDGESSHARRPKVDIPSASSFLP